MSDFDDWNALKKKVNDKEHIPLIQEGDIWWCHLGKNIGIESFGKGKDFSRPVLVIKKHNKNHLVVIPATTQIKKDKFYYRLNIKNKPACLLLSQIRTVDSKRLITLLTKISDNNLNKIKKAIYEINFQ